jgi:phage FluMu protein Com
MQSYLELECNRCKNKTGFNSNIHPDETKIAANCHKCESLLFESSLNIHAKITEAKVFNSPQDMNRVKILWSLNGISREQKTKVENILQDTLNEMGFEDSVVVTADLEII